MAVSLVMVPALKRSSEQEHVEEEGTWWMRIRRPSTEKGTMIENAHLKERERMETAITLII